MLIKLYRYMENGLIRMKNNLKKFYFKPNFYFENTKDFCMHLGISTFDIANLTGYHSNTVKRWINNNKPPKWLLPFLYATYGGVISCNGFYGWNLNDGIVNTPGNRYGLTGSQIETYHWHLDLMKQYQSKLMHIRKHEEIKTAGFQPKILKFTNKK